MWDVFKGLLAYDVFKWVFRNLGALSCGAGVILLLIFPVVWVGGILYLDYVGWSSVIGSMSKKPTGANSLLFITGILALLVLVFGVAIAGVLNTPGGLVLSTVVGMGYLYYGGAAIGGVALAKGRDWGSRNRSGSLDSNAHKPQRAAARVREGDHSHCAACGGIIQGDPSYCKWCGAALK